MGDAKIQKGMEERYFYFDEQEIAIAAFPSEGRVLDIGGGGEGIIGELMGDQVIAIDPNRRELEEAPVGPLKIVMDARELQFLEGSFETVTSFFTLMYISNTDHETVFSEVYRVLAPGGNFMIWDGILPPRIEEAKDIAVFILKITLSNGVIKTGYGARWPKGGRKLEHFSKIAKRTGFEVLERKMEEQHFFMLLQKP